MVSKAIYFPLKLINPRVCYSGEHYTNDTHEDHFRILEVRGTPLLYPQERKSQVGKDGASLDEFWRFYREPDVFRRL